MKVAFILVGLVSLSAGLQLTCQFKSEYWVGTKFEGRSYQTCFVKGQPIASYGSRFEKFSKDKAIAIRMRLNSQVKHIPTNLAAMPDLLAIDFGYCAISSIGEQFKGLRELIYLYLGWNHINDIQNDAFMDLVKLEYLSLAGNKLTQVNGIHFKTLVSLKALHLCQNQLKSIESSSFINLINLEYLALYTNELTIIESKTFQNLNKLEKLEIGGNKINSIDPDTFDALKNSSHIGLSKNICIDKNYNFSSLSALRNDVGKQCKPKNEQIDNATEKISTSEVSTTTKNIGNEIEDSKNQECSIQPELKKVHEKISDLTDSNSNGFNLMMDMQKTFKAEFVAVREEFAVALKTEQERSGNCSKNYLELSQKFYLVNSNLKGEQMKVADLTRKLKELEESYDSCMKIIE